MHHDKSCYIDGEWVAPLGQDLIAVINPATEEEIAKVALGGASDVDRAVEAARRAFEPFSRTTVAERIDLLDRIIAVYERRSGDLSRTLTAEMGSPLGLADAAQVPVGLGQLVSARDALAKLETELTQGSTEIVHEPIGVCGLITPWNWPLLLTFAKVAPALAAGCTVVLKPSEIAPLNSIIVAEILAEAGVPAGVFNLVQGRGPAVGTAIAAHPDIDMVSFTGSTRAGIDVARTAADTVKRVTQELGGKSANIVLPDADVATVVERDVAGVFANSGQSCNASTRILVQREHMPLAETAAARAVESTAVGDPTDSGTAVGPVVSAAQFDRVQSLLKSAIDDGARVVAGGLGRPEGLERGYYVRPTVLADVTNDMDIAHEEIFGPVVTLHAYDSEEDAIRMANDTRYGLSGMVSSPDLARARSVARRIRAGMVHINGAPLTMEAPFGGYKQSGNGREYGAVGIHEFLETKSVYGYHD